VLDHVGNTLRLGHHLEERDWTLDGFRKRDREAAPSVKVCPTVLRHQHLAPRRYARDCGHVFHATGAAVRLSRLMGELQELAIAARARKQEQGQAQTLQDLIALGHQRGYKNPVAWAKHLLAARQTKGQWSKIK
jgi:DNA repair protein RadD